MTSTTESVNWLHFAVQALAVAQPNDMHLAWILVGDLAAPLRLLKWHQTGICRMIEILWRIAPTSHAFAVEWHGHEGLQHRRIDGRIDTDGGLGVYANQWLPSAQVTDALMQFDKNMDSLLMRIRTGWWVANAGTVLSWPLYVRGGVHTIQPHNIAVLPARLGRHILAKHIGTHTLMVHNCHPSSQFDVFWRVFIQQQSRDGCRHADVLTEPGVIFGRIQHDVYFAMVRHDLMSNFMTATGISLSQPNINPAASVSDAGFVIVRNNRRITRVK